MNALLAPQASLVCRGLKETKGSQESQGEKAQKGNREKLDLEASQGPLE